MSTFKERIDFTKEELARAIKNEDKSVLIDTFTLELLVEAVTDLLIVNKEQLNEFHEKQMRMTLKHRDRVAKVREQMMEYKKKNDRMSIENRNLKQFRRNHEAKLMRNGKDESNDGITE